MYARCVMLAEDECVEENGGRAEQNKWHDDTKSNYM